MDNLTDRVALVTGASRGIGRDIAKALAAAGVRVAVNYRTAADKADEVVREIEAAGGTAVALQADVSEPGAAAALVRDAEARIGPSTSWSTMPASSFASLSPSLDQTSGTSRSASTCRRRST